MLVSVIITTYNRSQLLCRAIESVLAQTYKNIEIIVVDDCSSDDTSKVVKSAYANKVRYIRNKSNMGLAASRNIGIRITAGNLISFLDDDDQLLPEKIQRQVTQFENNESAGVIYCGSIRKYKNIEIENTAKFKGNIFENTLRACPNAVHTLLIKKRCLERTGGFDTQFKAFEDWDLWIRLSKLYVFDYVPEPLVIYHFHGQQMAVDLDRKISAGLLLLHKHLGEFKKNRKALHWHYRKLLSRCSLAKKYREALRYTILAIQSYPLKIAPYVHLVLLLTCRPIQKRLIYRYGLLKIGDFYIL